MSVAIAIALPVLVAVPARAGEPTDQVRAAIDRIITILEDPTLRVPARAEERRAALRAVVSDIFDFQECARRALGRHWHRLSEPQRAEFVSLFAGLLERTYVARIEQYGGEKIVYRGGSVGPGDEQAAVGTTITTKGGTEIPITYHLLRRGQRWAIYDVRVEGVSLVSNYRTQFDRIIQASSVEELVRRLRAGQGAAPAPGAATASARST